MAGVGAAAGQKITTLHNGILENGNNLLQWHGLNDRGQAVPSGTYFYRIKIGKKIIQRKVTPVR